MGHRRRGGYLPGPRCEGVFAELEAIARLDIVDELYFQIV